MDQTTRRQVARTLINAARELEAAVRLPPSPPRNANFFEQSRAREAHHKEVVALIERELAPDFKKAAAVAKRIGKALLDMLPTGFKVSLGKPEIGYLESSFVNFKLPVLIEGKRIASIEARYSVVEKSKYPQVNEVGDPKWTVNMWVPYNGTVYPSSSVSSGAQPPTIRHFAALLKDPKNPITVDLLLTAVGGPKVGRHAGKVTMSDITRFMAPLTRGGWESESESPTEVRYSSREYGDVGDGEPGEEDLAAAKSMVTKLRNEFGSAIKVTVEVVDEWVDIAIKLV